MWHVTLKLKLLTLHAHHTLYVMGRTDMIKKCPNTIRVSYSMRENNKNISDLDRVQTT